MWRRSYWRYVCFGKYLYLRGLIYYHIPTTMTIIVDSCIGGKTGINYKDIINSVGNYCIQNVFLYQKMLLT